MVHPSPAVADAPADYAAYLPLLIHFDPCTPIPGETYGTLQVNPGPSGHGAEEHPDLNLAVRGYVPSAHLLELVEYGGQHDPKAPQLTSLFSPNRSADFVRTGQVYDWDWDTNARGALLTFPEVTLAWLAASPSETIHVPESGYSIGSGYAVLVLYASHDRITLKYTREDNVIEGYTLHVENICVEPSLLDLYLACVDAGRDSMPALRSGQAFARATSSVVGIAIRDSGCFLDPRSRKDWWQDQ